MAAWPTATARLLGRHQGAAVGIGRKRHVVVDTEGLLKQAIVHAAGVQDRDGGVLLMATLFGLYPFLLKLYADSGYRDRNSGRNCTWSADISTSRSSGEATPASSSSCRSGGLSSAPLPSTYTSTNRCRRLAKDWERTNRNARAFLLWASIRLMLRKLCRKAT